MEKLNALKDKLLALWAKTEPFRNKAGEVLEKVGRVLSKIGFVLSVVGKWIYRLRSVFLTIPVVFVAIKLAIQNVGRLPEAVGLFVQADGSYLLTVSRGTAVMVPLGVTAVCLLMMFCSRRVVYPWLISIFTLVLPLLIYITNVFPA